VRHLPNIITIIRVPSVFVIAFFAAIEMKWGATIAFWLFFFAAASDYVDGWLARKLGVVSNFGKLMDALTDKILSIGMMLFLLVMPPILPKYCAFLVVIILVREFLITGLRLVAASSGVVLAAERSGKIKTVLQLLSIGILLFVNAARADWQWTIESGDSFIGLNVEQWYGVGLGFFFAATLLTVTSGTGYLIKYWKIFWEEPTTKS
jgi:CDP-diacylglycerol--glycerol-3-phosphate 3-phosphatidyltransferase